LIDVSILIADDHLEAIDDVAAALREAGLRRDQTLPSAGVITGAVDDAAALESMAAVKGVTAVEPARSVGIPPPDAPVQ
jgi:hypothetical protein